MGKIGDYEYPEFTFTECRKIVERIYKEGITRGDVLAPKLGHKSPESGTFRNKITSLQRFGLIEGDWKEFKLTELGEKIAKPLNEEEFKKAAIESIKRVNLLKELWKKVGTNIPEDGLWGVLVQITGVSRSVAEKQEAKIRKLYMDAVQYLKEEKEVSGMKKVQPEIVQPQQSTDIQQISQPVAQLIQTLPNEAIGRVIVKNIGYIDIVDEMSYNIAKEYLKLLAKKLGLESEGGGT
ncbi:hypothetical protein Ferp_1196 [Ferroglobus placidus DSM 10642]|uniref:Uncharacterized protein n=1 Tax=Ferroglobus placidus (strain DSM 10642 / AEDII12DO) TaxID=589924 RepID=D3RXZ1_FERPA|nr:hypothetical protein [Ferroglobus placidus]ADC65354.1 hypothetical protein Ferp_1196 [Ferroglobus placidus DSM 10642]